MSVPIQQSSDSRLSEILSDPDSYYEQARRRIRDEVRQEVDRERRGEKRRKS